MMLSMVNIPDVQASPSCFICFDYLQRINFYPFPLKAILGKEKDVEARPLNFSLFQNLHVINTVGYEERLPENSYYSKVSKRYATTNPVFVWMVFKEYVNKKLMSR